MKVIIDVYKDKIWGKNALNKQVIASIVKECFAETNIIRAKTVFLNVSFVNKKTITYYNYKYRSKKQETNVLSFANNVIINNCNIGYYNNNTRRNTVGNNCVHYCNNNYVQNDIATNGSCAKLRYNNNCPDGTKNNIIVNNDCMECYCYNNNIISLGEIMVCFEEIQSEAIEYNKSFKNRLLHMFVHSVLHLLGYDHVKNEEKKAMEKLETSILEKFRVYDIYTCDKRVKKKH